MPFRDRSGARKREKGGTSQGEENFSHYKKLRYLIEEDSTFLQQFPTRMERIWGEGRRKPCLRQP